MILLAADVGAIELLAIEQNDRARIERYAEFRRRFGYVEEKLAERGASPADSNIEEMESLWQQAKAAESNP